MTGPRQPLLRVAIVGAGWAGMAAAVELSSNNVPVTVFETARTLGGRARRVAAKGAQLDNGLHILIGAYAETIRLIRKVNPSGTLGGLRRTPLQLRVEPSFLLRAPRLPKPLHLAIALLFARGFGAADKLAAIRFMRALRAARFRCQPGITVGQLLREHWQPASVADSLWNPLCISALNTQPEKADAQVFLNVLRDSLAGPRSASDLLLPTVDFSALFPEPAADYVRRHGGDIVASQAVTSLRPMDNGFEVNATSTGHYSHVIVAVGPHRLETIAGHLAQLNAPLQMVRNFEYEPIYSVYLQYDPHIELPAPMIGLRNCLAQWVFDRGQLGQQRGMLAAVISASGPHESLSHPELARSIHAELADRFPLPPPKWHQVIAEKRATFSCVPNLQRPGNVTAIPGLLLAGDYTDGPYPATLEAAVRSGVACANHILDSV